MEYYAHGKLLLSGEYLVLKGARGLAIPSRYGQRFSYKAQGHDLNWKSYDHKGELWFEACFSPELQLLDSSSGESGAFLLNLLRIGVELSQHSIPLGTVETHLEFPGNWGLGSSSTLTYLIAKWLNIDPYKLFFTTQNGSGYDIACADATTALLYKLDKSPEIEKVTLPEVFKNVYFIHLNQKQNSRPAVTNFLKKDHPAQTVKTISTITQRMLEAKSVLELQKLMDFHEREMSKLLQTPPVKELLFSDFEGSIKSLGAWGGDFVMALGHNAPEYFAHRGYNTIISFSDMI